MAGHGNDDDDEHDELVRRGKYAFEENGEHEASRTPRQSQFEPMAEHGDPACSSRLPLLIDSDATTDMDSSDWHEHGNFSSTQGHRVDLSSVWELPDELSRPKSGLKSAFMNMANSIIGAGIIGQPYAFRQAGLLSGTLLLIGLTIVVDWTIRLIVVNSKLSGTNSFQGTVEKCFGRVGLVGISLAQWAFAFGGMVAFAVIVGDTIPRVLVAMWPGLAAVPILGLLTNRRVAIVVLVMGVSYPLTLYRDISKV